MSGWTVAVVVGGPSAEAEVSRTSGRAVHQALVMAGHRPTLLELDATLPATLVAGSYDVVFPVTHGPLGEDGCLQGLLEVLALPYVGSGVLASALAANKPHAKQQLRGAGLPVAAEIVVARGDMLRDAARRALEVLGTALVVKPASGGSAIGVTLLRAAEVDALEQALASALADDEAALVEALVVGHEVTCGVLDLEGPRALPPTLILSRAAEWYDFESKYAPGGSEHQCPAPFAPALTRRIQELAVAAFMALGARDLGRVDFIVPDAGDPVVLELNSLPGMTATSLFPEAAAVAGLGFPELCSRLVARARERVVRRAPPVLAMPKTLPS